VGEPHIGRQKNQRYSKINNNNKVKSGQIPWARCVLSGELSKKKKQCGRERYYRKKFAAES